MEYHEISKTQFNKTYNIVKVLFDINEIMQYLKTYKNDNEHAVAFGVKRKHQITLEDIMNEIVDIKENQAKDHELLVKTSGLLLKVIELNNLKTD